MRLIFNFNITDQVKEMSSYTRYMEYETTGLHNARTSYWCFDDSFTSFSTKSFNVNVKDKSQTKHFLTTNVDIVA